MRTLTAYGIGVITVLANLNRIARLVGSPRHQHDLNMLSTGFVLGTVAASIWAYLYYRRVA